VTKEVLPRVEVPAAAPTVEAERQRLADATRRAFIAVSRARQRHPHHFGLSSLGGCRRAGAYALSRTEPSDPDLPVREGRAANLGTWEHEGLLPALAAELPGARTEVPVTLRLAGLAIPGSIDLDDPHTVVDLKTVGEHRLAGVLRNGSPYYQHRLQAGGYGLARLQEGRPPRYVGWHYLDRANGEECIVVEPFTNRFAEEVVERVEELADWAQTPDEAPRDEVGPGLSFACDECPWLRRCMGPTAEPGNTRAVQVHTDAEIEAARVEYDAARAAESAAKTAKKIALAKVEGNPTGQYGRASYKYGKAVTADDPYAAARKLRALGLEVPQAHKRGAVQIKLTAPPKVGAPQ
jgi:hypothetical protein